MFTIATEFRGKNEKQKTFSKLNFSFVVAARNYMALRTHNYSQNSWEFQLFPVAGREGNIVSLSLRILSSRTQFRCRQLFFMFYSASSKRNRTEFRPMRWLMKIVQHHHPNSIPPLWHLRPKKAITFIYAFIVTDIWNQTITKFFVFGSSSNTHRAQICFTLQLEPMRVFIQRVWVFAITLLCAYLIKKIIPSTK